MAYTDIDKPDDYFNTVLYTGDMVDGDGTGHTQSITGVGFQPDWVWHKGRSNARTHILVDSVRGLTNYNWLVSSGTGAEITANTNGAIKSIDSDGITLENGTDTSSKANNAGANGETYVFWNWLAGGTASSNTDGSITSSVSANTTAGFSVVSYTGNGTSGATIGHGLSAKPSWIVTKRRNSAEDWANYHSSLTADYYMYFTTNASTNDATKWNDTEPTSSVFSVGNHASVNGSSDTYIAYCFAEKKGYSKFGSYTGNGNDNGTFVYTGFKPAWVMIKRTDSTADWHIQDIKRDTFNAVDTSLFANTTDTDTTSSTYATDFLSNGFKLRGTTTARNGSGASYIYMCFAESPFTSSTGIPTTAR